MPWCHNVEALINQCDDEELERLGIVLEEDGTISGLDNLVLPIELPDYPVMGSGDWDNIREGRFDLDGESPDQYARPA